MKFVNWLFGEFKSQKSRWLIIGVLVIGAILRLYVSWQPIELLVEKNLPDDAYYYFVLARNTIQLNRVSMDGINVTNGFHPLWWIVLLPIFGGSSAGSNLPISIALTLASLLDLVSIWIIAQLAVSLTHRWYLGIMAAWLYATNPFVILQITNGLETAIGILALLIFLLLMNKWLADAANNKLAILVGVSGGMMFLARSDSIFLLGFALLAAMWFRQNCAGFFGAVLAGATAFLTALPWLIWSRLVVGSWLQESGIAVPYAIRTRVALEQGPGILVILKESLLQLVSWPIFIRGDFSGLPFFVGYGLWALAVVGLIIRWRRSGNRLEIARLLPLIGSGLALVVAHAGFRWYPRPWYFVPSSIAFALAFVLAAKRFLSTPRRIYLATLAFTVYFVISGYVFWQIGYYPWQREMLAANNWLADNIPPHSNVASFNSGIFTYYNDFRVTNLDGVVNHQAYQAVRDRQILEYLRRSDVDYLIDTDWAIWEEYAQFMGNASSISLEEIGILSEKMSETLGYLRIYQVIR